MQRTVTPQERARSACSDTQRTHGLDSVGQTLARRRLHLRNFLNKLQAAREGGFETRDHRQGDAERMRWTPTSPTGNVLSPSLPPLKPLPPPPSPVCAVQTVPLMSVRTVSRACVRCTDMLRSVVGRRWLSVAGGASPPRAAGQRSVVSGQSSFGAVLRVCVRVHERVGLGCLRRRQVGGCAPVGGRGGAARRGRFVCRCSCAGAVPVGVCSSGAAHATPVVQAS